MSTITLIGAGQMASALTFPLYENGHEVRLVGSPLDDQSSTD
ncbi:NAD(P)-binding domain-containing protein [Dorea sp. AM58-8]|nr:NAD(P)-binding domain-containing protein [Dorea sp. AM58-8]